MKRGALVAAAIFVAARAHADEPVQEVQVHGTRNPKAAQTTLGGAEVRQVPGAFGDPFRVIESLPGVTPIVSGLPFFFVRGAPPGNNGYYLDGIRVPVLYHIGLGPSVVHPGLISKVDFFPGGYPARFGRFVGGILSGETKGPTGELHGEGNIRLFDAGALVEVPFDKGRGSVLVGGRYSYTAALVSLAAPDVRLDYWDYQARASYALTPDDTISAFAFGSYDFLGEVRREQPRSDGRMEERLATVFATQFHRLDLRWDHRLPHKGKMRVAATLGSDATATDEIQGIRDRMFGSRLYVEQPVGTDVLVRGGVDVLLDHYDLADPERGQSASNLYPPRNDLAIATHVDAVIHAAPRWEVVPGIRFDYFSSVRELAGQPVPERGARTNAAIPAVDPRLQSRLALTNDLTAVSTFAVTHQTPSFFIPVPGLQLGRLGQGLQTGVQTSQGLEISLPLAFTFTPTVFHHAYLGLNDFLATCGEVSDEEDDDCIDRRVRGRTVGFELLLRRALTQKLTGWISYTLSRTTRTTQVSLFQRRGGQTEIPGDFDRTHVLNVIGAYDLGAGWRAGARFFFYTGRPYSNRVFDVPVPPYNDQRMPAFHRFDARVEKQWKVGKNGRLSLVFEWLNFTLQKEVASVECRPAVGARGSVDQARASSGSLPPELLDKCSFQEIGPITIPSVGVEGAF